MRVNEAIDRGVAYLRGRQDASGSYEGKHAKPFALGTTGLVTYALVKSGVSALEPDLVRAAEFMTSRPAKYTYDAAFVILGLDAVQDPARYPHLRATARSLLECVDEGSGLWGYPEPPVDLSNTQLALLALRAAQKRDVQTPVALWKAVLKSLPDFRSKGGGYTYRKPPPSGWATGSMTTAALTILHLAERSFAETKTHRSRQRRALKMAAEAWNWMDRRFSADANPIGGHFATEENTYYYLYGLERAAAFGGRSRIGGRDWYQEGARYLLGAQEADGSWGSTAKTCFALLFLRRATFTSLGRETETPLSDESADGNGESDESGQPTVSTGPERPIPAIAPWVVLGPFSSPGELERVKLPLDEAKLRPAWGKRVRGHRWTRAGEGRRWLEVPVAGEVAHRLFYVGTWLHVSRDTDVVFWITHRGAIVARVGDSTVYERRVASEKERTVPVPVHLAEGVYPLVIRAETWERPVRLGVTVATREGRDARAVRWSLSAEAPDTEGDLVARPAVVPWPELLASRREDEVGRLLFDARQDVRRVCLLTERRAEASIVPRRPARRAASPSDARGLLEARLPEGGGYVTLVRRVVGFVPGAKVTARVAVVGPSGRNPLRRVVAQMGLYDGDARVFATAPLKSASLASRDPWTTLEGRLPDTEAESVLVFLAVKAEVAAFTAADRVYVDEFTIHPEGG